jgi:DnaJ-class molecular chaperone
MICRECAGRGWIEEDPRHGDDERPISALCKRCEGKGWLELGEEANEDEKD